MGKKKIGDEKILVILKAILMNKEYQDCFQKYVETKHTAHDKNDLSNHMAWYEMASKFGIFEPVDPAIDVRRISPQALATIKFHWSFDRGAVSMRWKEHSQLAGAEKVSRTIEVTIDLTHGKTKICNEVKSLVGKLQALRKKQLADSHQADISEEDEKFNCCLGDFAIYEAYLKAKGKNSEFTFHQMARKKLGKDEISTDVDLEAKKMENAYKRAQWLIGGGYEVLKRNL